ncbi:DUF223 domain protein [Medicago truncatula]|uniref:DUF223 domain protein n=1 Tax=Medicago truncatula TaxID=3880 RepID=G7JUK8_MEDTR|nr:DUF223 domain protein [Medicago truncatula]
MFRQKNNYGHGDRIGASTRRTLIYKSKEQLQEGMVFTISSFDVASNSGSYRPSRNEYKLNFTINTKVKLSKTVLVPTNVYSFTPASDVFNESYDNNFLVDVIGVMTGVGVEREYESDGVKTKMNVIELDSNGAPLLLSWEFQFSIEQIVFVASLTTYPSTTAPELVARWRLRGSIGDTKLWVGYYDICSYEGFYCENPPGNKFAIA